MLDELVRAGVRHVVVVAVDADRAGALEHRPDRAGPFANDDSLEWSLPDGGGRLTNTGCWVYEALFLQRGRSSPYWPGSVVELRAAGPPILSRLLTEVDPDALKVPDRG